MNYLDTTVFTGTGSSFVGAATQQRPYVLFGFTHQNPGGASATFKVGGANFQGLVSPSVPYTSSGGRCRFTLDDHPFALGDYVYVTSPSAIRGIQRVTAVTASTFDTDETFSAGPAASVYHGTMVFDVLTFTEFNLHHGVGPFLEFEVIQHGSAAGESVLYWTVA